MRYSQLRAFDAVARLRSFSRAAEKLCITQPAVSLHVKALEKDHALDLFKRQGGAVALTTEGQALFLRTREMFAAEAEIRDFLEGEGGFAEQSLVLGADGPHVALELVARLRRRHPELSVDVSLGNHRSTWEDLLAQNVDAAVMANPPERKGLLLLHLAVQRMVALLPAGHPLSESTSLSLGDLLGEPLIFREQGSNTQRILESALARAALTVTPAFVLRSREAVLAAVVAGLGLGFAFSREVGQDPRLTAVPLSDPGVTSEDMLVCLESKARQRRLAPLLELARSQRPV
jgi:aminoethylphosphonate catabolism LysR family transcriptional regulator